MFDYVASWMDSRRRLLSGTAFVSLEVRPLPPSAPQGWTLTPSGWQIRLALSGTSYATAEALNSAVSGDLSDALADGSLTTSLKVRP